MPMLYSRTNVFRKLQELSMRAFSYVDHKLGPQGDFDGRPSSGSLRTALHIASRTLSKK